MLGGGHRAAVYFQSGFGHRAHVVRGLFQSDRGRQLSIAAVVRVVLDQPTAAHGRPFKPL